ncbi:DNA-binding SARP family transcriptional activator [Streptomyces umbrinus]|uniref:DNA-binding SARP family transcriptional activator n=1 Tax=Streptomyces umbrinus TaxID=67370 RepID=A0ABU0SMI3_9ACTN|nr:BTAD domain-containing putative transcriptional regulator [Streptomyces umbrinus]MDQ1024770.1 DNA-binding SARP family transcriptional activator [Streptomyces umbrinus]
MTHPYAPQRLTAALTAGGTLALTLALLAGMPYVLWKATGLPWPEHVSSLGEFGRRLMQPVGDPLMIDLLAVVGWVCWAAFACTVVRETCWYTTHLPQLLRDRHAHDEHVAALSVKGSLAALCIGTLVIALIGLWRPQPVGAQQPSSPGEERVRIAATATLLPAPVRQPTFPAVAVTVVAGATSAGLDPEHPGPPGTAGEVRYIEYTVIEGDTLWDIAHTHMGDALTWPRIYALNKDRVQSDGAQLTDPDLIKPGWELTIPVAQNATPSPTPAPVPDAMPSPPSAPPTETAPTQPTPDQGTDASHEAGACHVDAESGRPAETAARKTDIPGPAAIGLGEASLIGITAAAGLLAARRYWYWHQHRLREPDRETEVPALSPLVDKAAQAAHAATRPRRPQDPDALVTYRTPPQKPRSAGTVTIGVRDNAEVSLDELALPGGCAWTGPGSEGAARALLAGILTAAERQRPGPPPVTVIVPEHLAESLLPGLPAQFTALAQSDTAETIRAAEQHLVTHARTQDEQDTDPAATEPASTNSAPKTGPGTLVLLTVPDAAHTAQLQALAACSRPGTLIILTLGAPLPGAVLWHIADDGTTAHPDGHDQPSSPLRLFHLTPEAGRDMAEVLLTAHGQRPRQRILPIPTSPPPDGEHPDIPATPTAEAPARPHAVEVSRPAQTKPVRLHVLGPITLYARGHQDPVGTNLRGEVHEFLALLAAHPTGLLASDIADKLHLDPGCDHNALKNLRRAVRRALRAATGITAQEFIVLQGELHKLHPELVETDLADFAHCLKEAFSVSGVDKKEDDALSAVRDALAHYRGPFAQGGDYLWADAIREHCAVKATDAVLRLARQAEGADATSREQDAVLTLLEHLSTIHPDHERLAQHTIRLCQAAGRHDAARHTYTRLRRHLADLGLEPEPATRSLSTPRRHVRQTGAL